MAITVKEALELRIKKPSRNEYTITDLINSDYDFTSPISEKEKIVLANSKSFRRLIFWIGRDEFNLSMGFQNIADVISNKNGNESWLDVSHKQFNETASDLRLEIVNQLIEAQGGFEFMHHVDSAGGTLSWPYPSQFRSVIEDSIMNFEGDHILPIKQGGTHSFGNIAIATANTNQFIKNQLTIEQLLIKHEDKKEMCQRIRDTQERRKVLFVSNQWKDLMQRLINYEQ